MPVVTRDGIILFDSAAGFVEEFRRNISKNGILADTREDWPVRVPLDFKIEVPGHDEPVPVKAEVVFSAGRKVGMQCQFDGEAWARLLALAEQLEQEVRAARPDPLAEPQAAIVDVVETDEAVSGAVEAAESSSEEESLPAAHGTPRADRRTQVIDPDQVRRCAPPDLTDRPTRDTAPLGVSGRPKPVKSLTLTGRVIMPGGTEEFLSALPLPLEPENLKKISVFRLISSISAAQLPLVLRFDREDIQAEFHFNIRGNLVRFAAPGCKQDMLIRLSRAGRIPRDKVKKLFKEMGGEESDTTAEEYLVRNQVVTPAPVWMVVREQAADALVDVRAGGECDFRLSSAKVTRRSGVPFGYFFPFWMDCALRDLESDEVNGLLDGLWLKYPTMRLDGPWKLESLDLDRRATHFLENNLVGRDTLRHARTTSPLGRNRTKRVFITLAALGLLRITDQPTLVEAHDTADGAINRELAWLQNRNRFEQLGVHWSHHPSTYSDAIGVVQERFGPESKWQRFHPETAPVCEAIIQLAKAARRFLDNTAQRKSYRAELVTPFQMEVSANLLFKQAELMIFRQELPQARQTMEVVVEMSPKPGYVTFLSKVKRMM